MFEQSPRHPRIMTEVTVKGFCEKHCQLTYFLTAAKILGRESNFGQDNLATWLFWFACN